MPLIDRKLHRCTEPTLEDYLLRSELIRQRLFPPVSTVIAATDFELPQVLAWSRPLDQPDRLQESYVGPRKCLILAAIVYPVSGR